MDGTNLASSPSGAPVCFFIMKLCWFGWVLWSLPGVTCIVLPLWDFLHIQKVERLGPGIFDGLKGCQFEL